MLVSLQSTMEVKKQRMGLHGGAVIYSRICLCTYEKTCLNRGKLTLGEEETRWQSIVWAIVGGDGTECRGNYMTSSWAELRVGAYHQNCGNETRVPVSAFMYLSL